MRNIAKMSRILPVDVIIFTRERHHQLNRSFRLWSQQPFHFIILDNSIEPLKISLTDNISYHHLPGVNYGSRAFEAIKYLKNSYAIICSDDESLVPFSIKQMIDFLEGNKKFASVGGKVIAVYKYGPRIVGTYAYKYMYGYVNKDENSKVRLRKHVTRDFESQIPIGGMYRLFRKEGMNNLLESFFIAREIKTPYIFQILGEIVSTSLGPNFTLNSVYWIRNWSSATSHYPDWNRNITFSSWWFDTASNSEKSELIKNISDLIEVDYNLLYEVFNKLATKLLIPDDKVYSFNFRSNKFKDTDKLKDLMKFLIKKLLAPRVIPKSLDNILEKESNVLQIEERIQIVICARMILS